MLLHQLEVFTQVAEKSGFSKAAESLLLSQSTASTHISNLEKHFGQKLFDRLGKEVVLTPFGEKLYPRAREMLILKENPVGNERLDGKNRWVFKYCGQHSTSTIRDSFFTIQIP